MSESDAVGFVFSVLLCGGPRLFRAGLRSLIESRRGLWVVGDTENVAEGAHIAAWQQPDVVVLDLASTVDPESLQSLRSRAPNARILGVARARDLASRRRVASLGVNSWVGTGEAAAVFLDGIEKLARRKASSSRV